MTIDRKKLLQQRSNARAVMASLDVPPAIKALAKQAADHAQVALELDAAVQRKKAKPPTE